MEALLGATAAWRTPGTFFRDGDPDIDWFTLATVEHTHRLGRAFVSDHFDEFDVATKAFFEQGLATDVDTYMAARLRRFGYIREIDDLLGADGFLLTPTNAASGWLADGRVTASSEPGQLPPEVYSTAVQNVLGLPAITLPAGLLDNGVPFGVQITGPRWSEGQLLHFARLWEEAYPWPLTAPGYEPLDSFLS
jgi:Asp-tRNA(Asn)/Glu-tRNA(Gln) amidotransferase A subunit family amidase